ncbi:uncharacterized protein LOC144331090 [Macaca mulatta]
MDRCPRLHSVSAVLQEAQTLAETSKNSYVSHLISSQPETQVIIETTGLIFYLVNQSTFMQLRKGKLSRIRSQPSGTTRSREYPGPAGPQVQPAPPRPVQRSWDTRGSPAMPPKAKGTGSGDFLALPDDFLPPQPPPPRLDDPELPPPPPDFVPPPAAVVKRPPMPHPANRHEASMFTSSK